MESIETIAEIDGTNTLLENEKMKKRLLLVGLPNAGKSTLFNVLTGGNRKVSNYSGITVDAAVGEFLSNDESNQNFEIVDLPGIYNLNPTSQDEAVTVATLLGHYSPWDKVIVLLDFQRLEASLSLAVSIKKFISSDVLILINKDDDGQIKPENRKEMQRRLGAHILTLSALATDSSIIDHFIRQHGPNRSDKESTQETKDEDPLKITTMAASFFPPKSLLEQKPANYTITEGHHGENEVAAQINQSLEVARALLKDCLNVDKTMAKKALFSQKIDRIILHPILGGIIFLALFYFIFNAIYTWAGPLMDFTEALVLNLGDFIGGYLPEGLLKSLVVDGIFAGTGGVVIFLPQIMVLFFLLSLLEQSGYISRAALITDRFMGFFGLNGKAFLPYMSGFACAIPGIMAARTLSNQRERMATIMTLPLITCSARLPVYILLVGTFVPDKTIAGIFNAQALSFFFLYFLGSFAALIIAKLLRLTTFKGETSSFLIDLPPYQRPSLKIALKQSWFKGKGFLKKAGTIILLLSIVIWVLSTFPSVEKEKLQGLSPEETQALRLEASFLGQMGKGIEPVIEPLGMNWKTGVGLLVSFGARELFVSALGTLYALGDETDEENVGLREKLLNEKDPETGRPIFDLATAWSILIFFVFSLQCTSTLAILKKESGGWKIPMVTLVYTVILGYTGSWIAYQVLSPY